MNNLTRENQMRQSYTQTQEQAKRELLVVVEEQQELIAKFGSSIIDSPEYEKLHNFKKSLNSFLHLTNLLDVILAECNKKS